MSDIDLDDIKSNGKRTCLHCGVALNHTNDSGWEMFTKDGVTTQPVCKWCLDSDSGHKAVVTDELN
jgi:hypothetical protein